MVVLFSPWEDPRYGCSKLGTAGGKVLLDFKSKRRGVCPLPPKFVNEFLEIKTIYFWHCCLFLKENILRPIMTPLLLGSVPCVCEFKKKAITFPNKG